MYRSLKIWEKMQNKVAFIIICKKDEKKNMFCQTDSY